MYRIALLIALLAALVVPVAGARSTGGSISLVAYSTPKAAFSTIIPAFNQTAAGKDVSFTQSYGPSADQAQAIVNGLPADVVDLSLEPDMRTLVKAGLVAPIVEREQVQGHRHALRRRDRLPPGKPEAHPKLERPDQAGRAGADAEPGHVGRRALERPRRVRRAAEARQDSEAGRAVPVRRCSSTSSCRTSRPATRSTRSSPARATRCSRTRTRRCSHSTAASPCTSTSRRRRSASTTRSR